MLEGPASLTMETRRHMTEVTWYRAVEVLEPHVVRISTPQGSGSGFLISNGRQTALCGIATAGHVIGHPHYWEGQ
jgi:hypothetical protein